MGSGDQTAKTALLLECQRVMEEIDALKGPPPKEGVGIKNDSNASAIADLIADLSAGNAIASESSPEADAAAVIEKAMREIQARALANFEAQDEETQQKIQQLLDTPRQQYNTLYAATLPIDPRVNNPRPREG